MALHLNFFFSHWCLLQETSKVYFLICSPTFLIVCLSKYKIFQIIEMFSLSSYSKRDLNKINKCNNLTLKRKGSNRLNMRITKWKQFTWKKHISFLYHVIKSTEFYYITGKEYYPWVSDKNKSCFASKFSTKIFSNQWISNFTMAVQAR